MTLHSWLREFQAKQHRSHLREHSLHRYRCTDAEFVQLGSLLLKTRLLTMPECAGFALYAAEWLRRCFDGGAWTWHGLFATLDSDLEHPPYDKMEHAIQHFWGINILRLNGHRQLLGTLLMQGGLPLRAIERDGNALREIFRRLLDEAIATPIAVEGLTRLAQTWAGTLPKTWQVEPVYQLLAEISETTALLSAQIPKGANPVEFLDEHDPSWRERLPLSMTEAVGQALFSFMVREAHQSAAMRRASLRVLTDLHKADDDWQIVRRVLLPHKLTRRELAVVLGCEGDTSLPYRLELYAQNERADQQHIATATLWQQLDDDTLYLIDARGRSRDLHIEGALELIALSGTVTFGPAALDGGEDRGPLPWVFRHPRGEEHRWEMVAQGSATLRTDEAMVVTTEASVPLPGQGGAYEERGRIDDRVVYHMVGKVRILADGELCRIHLGEASDDVADYSLIGSVLAGLGNRDPVFRGPPGLRASASGSRHAALHRGKQEWRGPGQAWSGDLSQCLGRVELRHIVDGETKHIRRGLDVVPTTFNFVAEPDRSGKSGRLRVSGLARALTAEFGEDETFTAEKRAIDHDTIEWRVTAVGDRVNRYAELRIHWPKAAASIVELPLPIADARFVTVDGRTLANESNVALDEVHRVTAEVVGEPGLVKQARLLLKLRDHQLNRRALSQLDGHMPLNPVKGQTGVARVELSRMLDQLRLRFAASQRPDARVELELDLQGHKRLLRVQRFPYGIKFDTGAVVVEAPETELPALTVESFPVDAPGAEPVVHRQTEPGRWPIDPDLLRNGARLALARFDGRVKTSTVLLMAPAERLANPNDVESVEPIGPVGPPQPVEQAPIETLAEAARAPALRLRERAFSAIIDRLVNDLDDPDWKRLDAYVHTLGDLHATTFDVIESLITRPKVVVIAMLRARHANADRIWSALEDLPFAWHLLPVRDWVQGISAWFNWSSRRFGERELPLSRVKDLCEFVTPRLPNSKLIFDLAGSAINGRSVMAVQQLGLLASVNARGPRIKELEDAKEILYRDMATRAEIAGNHHYSWPAGPLLSRIADAVAKLTPDLADLLFLDEPPFRVSLINAPVIAALWAAAPDELSPHRWKPYLDIEVTRRELLFEIRQMRTHAPRWYDKCFELTLFDAVGRRRNRVFGDVP